MPRLQGYLQDLHRGSEGLEYQTTPSVHHLLPSTPPKKAPATLGPSSRHPTSRPSNQSPSPRLVVSRLTVSHRQYSTITSFQRVSGGGPTYWSTRESPSPSRSTSQHNVDTAGPSTPPQPMQRSRPLQIPALNLTYGHWKIS